MRKHDLDRWQEVDPGRLHAHPQYIANGWILAAAISALVTIGPVAAHSTHVAVANVKHAIVMVDAAFSHSRPSAHENLNGAARVLDARSISPS